MAKMQLVTGTTSYIAQIFIQDSSSTTGAGLTGLTNSSGSLTAYYHRDTDTTATAISLVTMTVGTFTSSGFKEIDATNMPGWYQLCPPNAALASGAKSVAIHLKGATNMAPLPLEIELTAVNNQSATAFITGVNSLAPPTNWNLDSIDASGRRDISKWAGTAVATPNTAGVPVVDTRQVIRQGTAQSTGNSTTAIKLDSGASATTDFYKYQLIQVISGTGAPEAGICTAYDGSTKIATIAPAWPTAPDNTSIFQIFPAMTDVEIWKGTAVASPATAGVPDVNAKNINNVATTSITTINANLGTTQPTNFTGTAGSALVKSDMVDVAGAAVSTTTAQIGVNAVQVNGQTTSAAGAVTFPGTIASPTNITAGTITTVTNLTNAPTAGDFTATMKTSLNAATPTASLSAGDSPVLQSGTAAAGGGSTITIATAIGADSRPNGCVVKITSGTGSGQARVITGYVDSTKVVTVDRAWTTNPDNTSVYTILYTSAPKLDSSERVTANADQLAGQTVTAAAGVTFPSSVASPTNITAGTITTVTNLTNAPTAGDLTATMKTSVTTAATAATPVAASVTGAVGSVAAGGINRATFAADTGLVTIRSNTAQSGTSTTITLDASASSVTDFYINDLIVITGGTGIGQGRYCTAYNGSTKAATVTAWKTTPDNTSTFAIIAADAIPGATAPTAAQVATAVWTDLLAGSDFSTTSSVGKLLKDDIDAAVSSRMATYIQPTGFLAATFPSGTVASTTNITAGTIATVTNLTNAPTAGDFTATMKTSLNAATPVITLSAGDSPVLQSGTAAAGAASTITIATAIGADNRPNGCIIKITSGTGSGQARGIIGYVDSTKVVTVDRNWTTNPDNTSVYSILYAETAKLDTNLKVAGVVLADTVTTYTGNTPQTGDAYARLGAPAGASTAADIAAVNAKTTNLPAAPASTTNITAGTITTVTNLTNAPTNGDLTSTMKTSVTTAATAATPIAASVSGNIGGLAAGAKTDVENATWNTVLASHLTAGSTGAALNAAGAAGDPWSTTLPGAYGAGTAGNIVGNNLDAAVSSRLATSSYTSPPAAATIATSVWTKNAEGSLSFGDEMRLTAAAAAAGKLSGAATTTITIRDVPDTKNRIVATVTSAGDRTAFTTIDGT